MFLSSAHEFEAGASDVTKQYSLCFIFVPPSNGLHKKPVFGVNDPHSFNATTFGEYSPPVLGRIPKFIDHMAQHHHLCAGISEQMKLAVEMEKILDAGDHANLVTQLANMFNLFSGQTSHALANRQGLQSLSNLIDFDELIGVEFGHPSTAVCSQHDQPVALETPKGFANRNSADVKLLRENFLPNTAARNEATSQDVLSQCVCDAVAEKICSVFA